MNALRSKLKTIFLKTNKSIFLDLKSTFFIIGFYYLLKFSNYSPLYFPEILEKLNFKTSTDILGNIIKGITGILGITISVLIISIQLYRNKYDDYAIKIILKNKKLKRIISVFITNLILSYLCLISIDEISFDSTDMNRVYFMLLLFIFALIYLFSSIGSVIYSTSNIEILSNLKKDASNNSYLSLINISRAGNSFDFLKEKDSNPIIEIQKLTFLSIKNNDEIFFEQLCEFRKILICDTSRFSIKNNISNLHSRNIIELYKHYLVQPTFESLLKTKNERFLQLLINEISGVISYFHENKITNEINILTTYLYNDIIKELFIEPYFSSINQLFNNSIRNLYLIFQKYNEPVSLDIVQQTKWTIDGKEMDLQKSEDKERVLASYMEHYYRSILIYISQIESLIDLSIDLKSKVMINKTIGRFLNRGTFQDVVFDLDIGHPMINNFNDINFMQVKFSLTDEQRVYFIKRFVEKLINFYLKAFKSNLILQSEIEHVVDSCIYHNFMRVEKRYALIPIKEYLKGLNILFETDFLINSNFEYSNKTCPLKDSLEFAFENFNTFKNDILEIVSQLIPLTSKIKLRKNVAEINIINIQLGFLNNLISKHKINDTELEIAIKELNS